MPPLRHHSAGNVYIADTGKNRLRKVAPGGAINTVTAALSAPTGLAFDNSGNLYKAESTAYRLSRTTPDGTATPYAGTGFKHRVGGPRAAHFEQVGRSGRRERSIRMALSTSPS